MDWDLELKNNELQNMIHVYEEHIVVLEKEKRSLQLQVDFLKEQLEYKTFGKPLDLEEDEWVAMQDYTNNRLSFIIKGWPKQKKLY